MSFDCRIDRSTSWNVAKRTDYGLVALLYEAFYIAIIP